jgi:hypothetical protein
MLKPRVCVCAKDCVRATTIFRWGHPFFFSQFLPNRMAGDGIYSPGPAAAGSLSAASGAQAATSNSGSVAEKAAEIAKFVSSKVSHTCPHCSTTDMTIRARRCAQVRVRRSALLPVLSLQERELASNVLEPRGGGGGGVSSSAGVRP